MADFVRASHEVFGTRLIPSTWLEMYPEAWTELPPDDPGTGPDPLSIYVRDVDLPSAMDAVAADLESAFSVRQRAAFGARVSVKTYGATGDETTDDTTAINAAIAANPGRDIYFPPGTYMVDAADSTGAGGQPVGIKLNQPGIRLVLDGGATIKALPNSGNSYSVIQVTAADCAIVGGTVQGDRPAHIGTTGEWGHCIDINAGADRCTVQGVRVRDAWGDGILVMGRPEDVSLVDVRADDCRRQGASIIDAIRPRVLGGHYNGTAAAPGTVGLGAGLILEPDPDTARDVIDALVVGCVFEGNAGPGFVSSSNGRTLTATIIGVRSTNNGVLIGDPGFRTYGATNHTTFMDCEAVDSALDGFFISPDCVGIKMVGCTASGSGRHGFGDFATGTILNGCTAEDNAGAAYFGDAGADSPVVTSLVARGNCTGETWKNQIDVAAPNARLTAVVSDAGGVASLEYGYVLRPTATGARVIGSSTAGTFVNGPWLDLAGDALAFPKPGAARQVAIGSPTADTTSLKNSVDAIRVALTNLGITP